MLFEELHVKITSSSGVPFLAVTERAHQPGRSGRRALLTLRRSPWLSVAISASGSADVEPEQPSSTGTSLTPSTGLTAYTAYYNHHRSHQALENQTPIKALKQEGSI